MRVLSCAGEFLCHRKSSMARLHQPHHDSVPGRTNRAPIQLPATGSLLPAQKPLMVRKEVGGRHLERSLPHLPVGATSDVSFCYHHFKLTDKKGSVRRVRRKIPNQRLGFHGLSESFYSSLWSCKLWPFPFSVRSESWVKKQNPKWLKAPAFLERIHKMHLWFDFRFFRQELVWSIVLWFSATNTSNFSVKFKIKCRWQWEMNVWTTLSVGAKKRRLNLAASQDSSDLLTRCFVCSSVSVMDAQEDGPLKDSCN